MAAALESVVKQLTESGIIAANKLEDFVPPKAHPTSVQELIAELVKQQHLTRFQAHQVANGRARFLILGSYTILDKIGSGGMGQVYKAVHRRMDRTVAIKVLPAAMMKDPAIVARFEREVRAAAKLNHTNIVTAYDADQANGVHFLVMEYVAGRDLAAMVDQQGPLPADKAVEYIVQAARGLDFAHKKGVIHRDIKPANLLVDGEDTVKILDMGLARIENPAAAGDDANGLTTAGHIVGTVDFMAPEQGLDSKNADARADIYSLGCTLYYLLTGQKMYHAGSPLQTIMAHQQSPIPPLSATGRDVPPRLCDVYQRMVAKQPADRYQTMPDVIAALQNWRSASPTDEAEGFAEAGDAAGSPPASDSATVVFGYQTLKRIIELEEPADAAAAHSSRGTRPLIPDAVANGTGAVPVWQRRSVVLAVAGAAVALLLLILVVVLLRGRPASAPPAALPQPAPATAQQPTDGAPASSAAPAGSPGTETGR